MRQPKSRNKSLILIALLIAVMTIFAGAGMTYAYFQGSKLKDGEVNVGNVGIKWYNGLNVLSNSTIYQLAGVNELERGNTDGTSLLQTDGTSGGDLRLQADSGAEAQYVRVKYEAKVGDVDVSSYLSFRYVASSSISVFGSNTFWKKGNDNYYYYVDKSGKGATMKNGNFSILFNNIVLSGAYPTSLLGETITIAFTYETVQSANISIASVWGEDAKTALGL